MRFQKGTRYPKYTFQKIIISEPDYEILLFSLTYDIKTDMNIFADTITTYYQ